MHNLGAVSLLVAVAATVYGPCAAFPDGAPIEACILGNKPNHYGTKAKPAFDSKVDFYATDFYYEPNRIIYVHIEGPPFKGFFVQARDAKTKKWIGEFVDTDDIRSFKECSAATHKTVPAKTEVVLAWKAPPHGRGEVFFTGTVLERYDSYWSGMVAKTPIPNRQG